MKKKDNPWLWVILFVLFILSPSLFVLGLIVFAIYSNNNSKSKIKEKMVQMADKYKNSDKTHNYEVIDTSAEVIDCEVIEDKKEWKATKEYKH